MQDELLSPTLDIAVAARPEGAERYLSAVYELVSERRAVLEQALVELAASAPLIAEAAVCIVRTLRRGGKVLVVGNGGSAAEAQHFACELLGRFQRERRAYAVLALTADSATLTAIGNDYGYTQVFARQVAGLGRPGDLLVAFSTSGASPNVVEAAVTARDRDMTVLALTGRRPSRLEEIADLTLRAPAPDTPMAQEVHMLLTHILCGVVEAELAGDEEVA